MELAWEKRGESADCKDGVQWQVVIHLSLVISHKPYI